MKRTRSDRGSVLPMVLGMGAMMMLAGAILIIQSRAGQSVAQGRTSSGSSLAVAEGGVARTLVLMTKPNNSVLLNRNYDPINPKTGTTYLGADGVINSGDEETTAVDSWTTPGTTTSKCGPPPTTGTVDLPYQGTIGSNGQYKLLAYRYNIREKTGTLLVEGKEGNISASHIAVKVAINTEYKNFPGIAGLMVSLNGAKVTGANGNVAYDPTYSSNPSLTGYALLGNTQRSTYLNMIGSSAADNVSGSIISCSLYSTSLAFPTPTGATNLGSLYGSWTITNTSGAIESYQATGISLENNEILTVDTTKGPVYIYVSGAMGVMGNAKILNIRSDGKPPQVGDLRLIFGANPSAKIQILDRACIENAFLFKYQGETHLNTTGDGCPSNGNTNFDGVLWSAALIFSSNSGVNVPGDLSSLSDSTLPGKFHVEIKNQLNGIQSWQQVKL